jgi:hypothetical protein
MKFHFKMLFRVFAMLCLMVGASVKAQPDYPNAIWRQAFKNHWYTTGNGHKFNVIHDMEGYYWTTINYFQLRNTQASSHYCVNGLKDATSDSAAGEVTQMVRDAYYAWHALCWNKHSFGTEHEGFVSNPAWYTFEQYKASADLQRWLCDTHSIAKDRNHIVGHNEYQNTSWVNWANANLGIDATCCNTGCQTHTDPGQYWNWTYFMALINNAPVNNSDSASVSAPSSLSPGQAFTATITLRNIGNQNWISGGTNPYRLGSWNPADNTRWGFSRVDLPSSPIVQGQTVTFNLSCTAPTTEANYPFEWRMVQEGVDWFGAVAGKTITVGSAPVDIIIDNPAATVVGSWSTGTSAADRFGSDYRYKSGAGGANYLQYTPNIAVAGTWQVYEWHSQGSNRTTNGRYAITYNGGTQTVQVNQQVNGGRWNLLGTFNFTTGSAGFVRVTDGHTDTAQVVIADAIKFVYAP